LFPACRRLAAAYAATSYVILSRGREVPVRLGRHSPAADHLLGRGAACFVTACNPFGLMMPSSRNHRAMARLRAALRARGMRFLPGEGRGDDGAWPPEESLLVMHLRTAEVAALGRLWRQNAVVQLRRGRKAVLVPLR
jgi:hypothetical protein